MIKMIDKNAERQRRHTRVRKKITGTAQTPRLNVYRSLNHIYVQIIDDTKGVTLCSASTMEKAVKSEIKDMTKTDAAKAVGKAAAKKALDLGIKEVRFRQRRLSLYGTCTGSGRRRKRSRTQFLRS